AVQGSTARYACYFAICSRSVRGFNPNDLILRCAVRTLERCRLGTKHMLENAVADRRIEPPNEEVRPRRKDNNPFYLACKAKPVIRRRTYGLSPASTGLPYMRLIGWRLSLTRRAQARCAKRHKPCIQRCKGRAGPRTATLFERAA